MHDWSPGLDRRPVCSCSYKLCAWVILHVHSVTWKYIMNISKEEHNGLNMLVAFTCTVWQLYSAHWLIFRSVCFLIHWGFVSCILVWISVNCILITWAQEFWGLLAWAEKILILFSHKFTVGIASWPFDSYTVKHDKIHRKHAFIGWMWSWIHKDGRFNRFILFNSQMIEIFKYHI